MCEVYNVYNNELVITFPNRKDAEAYLADLAEQWNYGIWREWSDNEWDYFDIGPRVYKIKHEEK